jgi:alkaline phosphatase D
MSAWKFVYTADMQPGSPRSYRYNPSWIKNWHQAREQILEIDPDLLLIGGDITRDGSIHLFELEEMKEELDSFPFPVYVIPGNMDTGNKHTDKQGRHRGEGQCTDQELNVTSKQLQQFAAIFGDLWWSVDHKNVRFSGFADMAVNSGLDEEEDFWLWAEEQKKHPPAEHHVWIMHYPLFAEDPDEPNWNIEDPDPYQDWYFSIDLPGRKRLMELFKETNTDIVISGHVHCHKVMYAQGIRFEIGPATSFGQWKNRWQDGDDTLGFLVYTVSDSGIECEFISLKKTYKLEGYGPGGHPSPEARDYSS